MRAIDNETLIFFEPVTWDNWFKTGFKTAPGRNLNVIKKAGLNTLANQF